MPTCSPSSSKAGKLPPSVIRPSCVIAAKPTAAYDAKWGGGFMPPAVFTGLVFEGV
jgi:hypothetical protein